MFFKKTVFSWFKIGLTEFFKFCTMLVYSVSQGGRGSKMYAHLLSRRTNSIVDNFVV